MEVLFIIVFWIAVLGFFISLGMLIYSGVKKNGKAKRNVIILASSVVVFFGSLLGIEPNEPEVEEVIASGDSVTDDNSEKTEGETTSDIGSSLTFGYTAEEFKKKFNKVSGQEGIDLEIGDFKIEEKDGLSSFKYQFLDTMGIVGSVEKDTKKVKLLRLIYTGGDEGSALKFMEALIIMVDATNAELSKEKRNDILSEFGFIQSSMDQQKFDNLNEIVERNGVKYRLQNASGIGLILTVQPI